MSNEQTERIDKFLWAVRLFKTRSLAADACTNKSVLINDLPVKSSKNVSVGDTFKVRQSPVYREFKIISITKNRVGAKLVSQFIEEITSAEELEKLKFANENIFLKRDRGTGRPTKKDRRDLRDYFG